MTDISDKDRARAQEASDAWYAAAGNAGASDLTIPGWLAVLDLGKRDADKRLRRKLKRLMSEHTEELRLARAQRGAQQKRAEMAEARIRVLEAEREPESERLNRLRDTNASLSRRACDAEVGAARLLKELTQLKRDMEARHAETSPARTLRIEVTGEDEGAAFATYRDAPSPLVSGGIRAALECYASRLAARQWVEVPEGATIPAGMPYRNERGVTAHEFVRATDHRPEDRTAGWTYYVPADRVAELTYPDAELIEAMAQALYEGGWDDADKAARTHHRHAAERALATVRHHDEARP